MATLGSHGLMLVSEPSTVTACSGRLEKSYQQVATLSGLGWSETTLSTSVSAGTNLVHRSLMAPCIVGLTLDWTQTLGCGSTVSYTARQDCARTGGVNVSTTCVVISSTDAVNGSVGAVAAGADVVCDRPPDRMDRCDIQTRRVRPRNWEPVVRIR